MMLRGRFALSGGVVEILYPRDMTEEDLKDFEDTVAIIIRQMRRHNAIHESMLADVLQPNRADAENGIANQ